MRISVVLALVVVGCGSVSSGEPDGAAGNDGRREDGSIAAPDGSPDGSGADGAPADAHVYTQACTFQQAEHPGYTTIARDIALCGGTYTPATIATACNASWHVCRVSEWTRNYPTDRPYKTAPTDPDLIGPTLGTLTTWGDSQAARCATSVWECKRPEEATPYLGSVCHLPDDTPEQTGGADYNPYNTGKYLFADDGTTILAGISANGTQNWGSWDATFAPTEQVDGFAVYCCVDGI